MDKKNVFAIIGSASRNSTNRKLIEVVADLAHSAFNLEVFDDLKALPHFDAGCTSDNPPQSVRAFREAVAGAEGIIICTPEYIFSIPSGLKNALEWCVSTMVFSDKPTGLITASAQGQRGHEELQLIMKTIMAKFTNETTLLIPGIRGKVSETGELKDNTTKNDLMEFVRSFKVLMDANSH